MAKKGSFRDLQDSLDNKWAEEAHLSGKDHFSKTVSDLRKLMSQSLSEEEKLEKGRSMYAALRQDRTFESFPIDFQKELERYFGDKRAQGQQKGDRKSPSSLLRPDLVHGDNQCVDGGAVCKQSAHSPSQSRKQAAQSGEQENQDGAKLLERVKRLEQDRDDERKMIKSQIILLENRLVQIKEKDGEIKTMEERIEDLATSKLAGAKLQDQNADIADLSDPNRAMKLSERFGQLFDDEWTNAFELLTDKKLNMPVREAIALLLRILQDCLEFCNVLVVEQMDSLKSVIVHPVQDLIKYSAELWKNSGGMRDVPSIGSEDEQALRVLRRQIGVSDTVVEEIKQVYLLKIRDCVKDRKSYACYKKPLEACTPYIQKCAGICWLMVLHDPPLYMKMDSNPGEKLNLNIFTLYSTPGDELDYIVWPPLFNGGDGGLLSKGSAEPLRTIVKKK